MPRVLYLRLTPEEYEALKEACFASRCPSLQQFGHDAVMDAVTRWAPPRPPVAEAEEDVEAEAA